MRIRFLAFSARQAAPFAASMASGLLLVAIAIAMLWAL